MATSALAGEPVRVGSKAFTESVILAELATQLGNNAGVSTIHRKQLGGTRVLWETLLAGQIDIYPEYTGTIIHELIPGTPGDTTAIDAALRQHGIGMSQPLGFNDTYALGIPEALARQLSIRSISDLRERPLLRFGFSNEFLNRKDGWPTLKAAYALPQTNVTGLDHDLAYRAVSSGSITIWRTAPFPRDRSTLSICIRPMPRFHIIIFERSMMTAMFSPHTKRFIFTGWTFAIARPR